MQILLTMRSHITFAAKDDKRDARYTRALEHIGIHVTSMPALDWSRVSARYDLVVVARRECFDDVHGEMKRWRVAETLPVVFDTVDLHYLRERRRVVFREAHKDQPKLLEAVFGKAFAEEVDGDVRELTYMREYSNLTIVVSDVGESVWTRALGLTLLALLVGRLGLASC